MAFGKDPLCPLSYVGGVERESTRGDGLQPASRALDHFMGAST